MQDKSDSITTYKIGRLRKPIDLIYDVVFIDGPIGENIVSIAMTSDGGAKTIAWDPNTKKWSQANSSISSVLKGTKLDKDKLKKLGLIPSESIKLHNMVGYENEMKSFIHPNRIKADLLAEELVNNLNKNVLED